MTGYDWFIILFAIPGTIVVGVMLMVLIWAIGRDICDYLRYGQR